MARRIGEKIWQQTSGTLSLRCSTGTRIKKYVKYTEINTFKVGNSLDCLNIVYIILANFQRVVEKHKYIDILINDAGIANENDAGRLLDVNVVITIKL